MQAPKSKSHLIVIFLSSLVVVALALLWSFNTLSPLFGGPVAQFRHALAVLVPLMLMWLLWRSRSASEFCRRKRWEDIPLSG